MFRASETTRANLESIELFALDSTGDRAQSETTSHSPKRKPIVAATTQAHIRLETELGLMATIT